MLDVVEGERAALHGHPAGPPDAVERAAVGVGHRGVAHPVDARVVNDEVMVEKAPPGAVIHLAARLDRAFLPMLGEPPGVGRGPAFEPDAAARDDDESSGDDPPHVTALRPRRSRPRLS
ncbi:MAG: hypothetical protein ACLFTL_11305, partial [Alphaproteobacteria bacterium]